MIALFFRWLCWGRARRAGYPRREWNPGPARRDTAGPDAFRGDPGKGPTQRPHQGRRPTAPSEDPWLQHPPYRRHQSRSPPRPVRIASRVLIRSEPGRPPATPRRKVRRVFLYGIYGIGFTLRPPLETGLTSRAHAELRPQSAPVGRLPGSAAVLTLHSRVCPTFSDGQAFSRQACTSEICHFRTLAPRPTSWEFCAWLVAGTTQRPTARYL